MRLGKFGSYSALLLLLAQAGLAQNAFLTGEPTSSTDGWINAQGARHFEEFTVTNPVGIVITSLWSHNFIPRGTSAACTNAEWSVRTLVSPGDGGSIIATGSNILSLQPDDVSFSHTVTYVTGPATQWYDCYAFVVTNLRVALGPGTYSFSVMPLVDSIPCFDGRGGCSPTVALTDGANAAGHSAVSLNAVTADGLMGQEPRYFDSRQDQAVGYSAISGPFRPELSILPDGSGGFYIDCTGASRLGYQIEFAITPSGPWRSSAAQVAPNSGIVRFWDLFPGGPRGFYRVRQAP